ncbi:MAG: hypothetical protein ACE5DW_04450 [Thermodesulfobacteriota bacterium]
MIEGWKTISISRRAEWAAAVILTALIVYLHFTFLRYAGPFWRDEINSINLASLPSLKSVLGTLHLDSFPVLYTLVLRLWSLTGGGGSVTGLRFLGFLTGLAITAVIWLDAWFFGRRVPLLSLALFGLSSLLIRVGDSIRPYGLGIVLILLAFGLIWRVVESPAPRRVLAALVVSVLSVHCLYTNAFLIFSILLGGAVVTLRRRLWKRTLLLMAMGGLSALSLVPYIGVIQEAREWIPMPKSPITYELLWNVLLKDTLGFINGYITLIWGVLFLFGIIIAIRKSFFRRSVSGIEAERALFCATVMTVTIIIFFIFNKTMQVTPFPRYFLLPMAVVALSLNELLGEKKKIWALGRIGLSILIVVVTFNGLITEVRLRQTGLDIVAAKMESAASKDDMIFVAPWFYGITFNRYYRGEAPWMTIPSIKDLTIHREDLLKKKMEESEPFNDVFEEMSRTLKRGGAIWLVIDRGLPLSLFDLRLLDGSSFVERLDMVPSMPIKFYERTRVLEVRRRSKE